MEKRLPSIKRISRPAEALSVMDVRAYVRLLPGGEYPEHDPQIWADFFAYRAQFPDMKETEDSTVYLALGRYALFLDAFDNERAGMNWALSTSIIDIPLTVTFAEFQADKDALQETFGEHTALTDSFMFADGYGSAEEMVRAGLIGLNSPVAALYPTFDAYLESLNSDRRKKFRRMDQDEKMTGLRFEMSQKPLSEAEFKFVVDNLKLRWKDDYLYALMQTLWSMAVAKHRPAIVHFMRVYDQDRLVFMQSLIARGTSMYCQSIVKDEATHYDGIAAYTDFQCVKALCGSGFAVFDPSCRTGLNDPESIGVAKRATINKNQVKPIFAAGGDLPEDVRAMISKCEIQGKPL